MLVVVRVVEAVGLGTVVIVVGPANSVRVSGEEVGFGVGGVVVLGIARDIESAPHGPAGGLFC